MSKPPTEQALKGTGCQHLRRALELFAGYDKTRLLAFRERGDRERVAIQSFGDAQALRFDEVGYFNRVYGVDAQTVERLPEVLAFYEASEQPLHLVAAADSDLDQFSNELSRFGFQPGATYARMGISLSSEHAKPPMPPSNLRVVTPTLNLREAFLEVYLRGFGAQERNFSSAKANMSGLFELPDVHFWMALLDDVPASVGVLYLQGNLAGLCGGASLPEFTRRGCHRALIQQRLAQAQALGATRAVAWAHEGSDSHRNMLSQNFETLGSDRGWLRPKTTAPSNAN